VSTQVRCALGATRRGHRGAWLLAQGNDVVPIPGTRAARVEENLGAAAVELSPADLDRIHKVIPEGAYGLRYPEAAMPNW